MTFPRSSAELIKNTSIVSPTTLPTVKDALDYLYQNTLAVGDRPLYVSVLDKIANGQRKWNTTAYIQDNATTYENGSGQLVQLVTLVDTDSVPWIGRRLLPDGEFSWFDLSTVSGNPLVSPVADDSHNIVVVAVDSSFYIHVVGNMHDDALRYVRSTSPDSIAAFASASMTGSDESSVSYPTFVKTRTNKLLFFYRDGVSGDGNLIMNTLTNPAAGTWTGTHHPLIESKSINANPYWWHIPVSSDNVIHLIYCWHRLVSDDSEDMCYMKSDDEGVTWEKTDGTAFTLPVTKASSEIILNTADTGSGLLNQGGAECDLDNRPHVAIFLYDSNDINQVNHLYLDSNNTWQVEQVTDWERGTSLAPGQTDAAVSRPGVFTSPDNHTYFYFNCKYTKRRSAMWCVDVTPGITDFPQFSLANLDLGESEIVFDTQALYLTGNLYMFMQTSTNGPPSIESNDCWDYQIPMIFQYNLELFAYVQAGLVELPYIECIQSASLPTHGGLAAPTTTSTTYEPVGPKLVATDTLFEEGIMYIRYQFRGQTTGGTMNIIINERKEETPITDVEYGTLNFASTIGLAAYGTPWMPSRLQWDYIWDNDYLGGTLRSEFKSSSGSFTATANLCNVELGVLRLGALSNR